MKYLAMFIVVIFYSWGFLWGLIESGFGAGRMKAFRYMAKDASFQGTE